MAVKSPSERISITCREIERGVYINITLVIVISLHHRV